MPNSYKIAQIWYAEQSDLRKYEELKEARPHWEISLIHEGRLNFFSTENIVGLNFDAILIHLSHPYALGLRIAEIAHYNKSKTKIILLSNTRVPQNILSELFDGLIRPDTASEEFCLAVEKIILQPKTYLNEEKCEKIINDVFKHSVSLQDYYRRLFKNRHKEDFAIKDYYLLVGASAELAHKNFLDKSDVNELFELISKDNLKMAFSLLHKVKIIESNFQLLRDLTLLENRFNRIESEFHRNIIRIDDYNIEKNNLVKSLSWFVESYIENQNQY